MEKIKTVVELFTTFDFRLSYLFETRLCHYGNY